MLNLNIFGCARPVYGGQMLLQDLKMVTLELQSISNAGECLIFVKMDIKLISDVLYDYILLLYI